MSRVALISLLILLIVLWLGVKARKNDQQNIAAALFTVAAVFAVYIVLGFTGLIGR